MKRTPEAMPINKDHIERVFRQKFSLLDNKKLQSYFLNEQLNGETKSVIRDQWVRYNCHDDLKEEDLNPVYYKLYHAISQKEQNSSKRILIQLSKVAAIIVLGILIYSTLHIFYQKTDSEGFQPIEFISQSGFRNQFKLPDGTEGWLGRNSELKYYVSKEKQRVVELDGLAFFNVEQDKTRPFIVNTSSGLNVEVLGTKFNVSSYSEEEKCEVVLVEGAVSLSLYDKNIAKMNPAERVLYDVTRNELTKSIVEVNDYIAWKEGKLVLNDVSLEEGLFRLSKYYNVEFDLEAQELPDSKIRLILEDESLDEVLILLSTIVPIEYEIVNAQIKKDNKLSSKKIIIKNK